MPLGYFTDSTPLTPLRDPFNVLVDGINAVETAVDDLEDARAIQTFRWADTSERNAQTGMQAGDIGYQDDNGVVYRYSGGAWRMNSPYALIVPTSISGGTVSAETGVVTFAGQTAISIDSVFTSSYPFYEVEIVHTGPSSASVGMVLRASGSDQATGYDRVSLYGQNSTTGSANGFNAASWVFNTAERNSFRVTLINPAIASPTQMRCEGFSTSAIGAAATTSVASFGGQHRPSTACDGLKVTFSSSANGFITIKGRY